MWDADFKVCFKTLLQLKEKKKIENKPATMFYFII
jgi:hypothetical protein